LDVVFINRKETLSVIAEELLKWPPMYLYYETNNRSIC